MSGHKPFQTLADRVTATPEGRERVETYRRLMDAVMTLHRLREERGLTPLFRLNAPATPQEVSRACEVDPGQLKTS